MKEAAIHILSNCIGPFLFLSALTLLSVNMSATDSVYQTVKEWCYSSNLKQNISIIEDPMEVSADDVKAVLITRPAYEVVINNDSTYLICQFYKNGCILLRTGSRNPSPLDEEQVSVIQDISELPLNMISGSYSTTFNFNSVGELTTVIYTIQR